MLPSLISPPALVSENERGGAGGTSGAASVVHKSMVRRVNGLQQQDHIIHPPRSSSREGWLTGTSPHRGPATTTPIQLGLGASQSSAPHHGMQSFQQYKSGYAASGAGQQLPVVPHFNALGQHSPSTFTAMNPTSSGQQVAMGTRTMNPPPPAQHPSLPPTGIHHVGHSPRPPQFTNRLLDQSSLPSDIHPWHDSTAPSPRSIPLSATGTPSSSAGPPVSASPQEPRKSMSSTYLTTATSSSANSLSLSASTSSLGASTDPYSDNHDDDRALPYTVADRIPFSTLSFEDDPDVEPDQKLHTVTDPELRVYDTTAGRGDTKPNSDKISELNLNVELHFQRSGPAAEEADDAFGEDALVVLEEVSAIDAVEEVVGVDGDNQGDDEWNIDEGIHHQTGANTSTPYVSNIPPSSSSGSFTAWTQSWPSVSDNHYPLVTTTRPLSDGIANPSSQTRWRRKTDEVTTTTLSNRTSRTLESEQILSRVSRESANVVVDDGLSEEELRSLGLTSEELDKMLEEIRNKVGERDTMREASLSDDPKAGFLRRLLCSSFDFRGQGVDDALRTFLQHFELAKESQQIDRMIDAFAERYWRCNGGGWLSKHEPHVLSASLLMLNTDLYSPYIRKKMTREEFVDNTKFGDGKDLPSELLEILYENIKSRPVLALNTPAQSVSSNMRQVPKSSITQHPPPPLTPRAAFKALANLAWNPSTGASGVGFGRGDDLDATHEAERRAARDEVARVMDMRAVYGVGKWDGRSSRSGDSRRHARSQSGASTRSGGGTTTPRGSRDKDRERPGTASAQARVRNLQISRHASLLGPKLVSRESPGQSGVVTAVAGQMLRSATVPESAVVVEGESRRTRPRSMVLVGPSVMDSEGSTSGGQAIVGPVLADVQSSTRRSPTHARSASAVAGGSSGRPFSIAGDYAVVGLGNGRELENDDDSTRLPWFDATAEDIAANGATPVVRLSYTAFGAPQIDTADSGKAAIPPPMSAIATRPPYSEPAKLVLDPVAATITVHQPPFRQVGREIQLFAAMALRRPDEPGGWRLCTSTGKEFPFAMLGGDPECEQWCAAVNARGRKAGESGKAGGANWNHETIDAMGEEEMERSGAKGSGGMLECQSRSRKGRCMVVVVGKYKAVKQACWFLDIGYSRPS
ncbi:hypothetical protein HDU93_004996 [Gonapodya sp. JEL0774]|nr:hypothetical protein HDU93_004996 [Gonapodya sp. JEL0774]